jgi:hypothetical protein
MSYDRGRGNHIQDEAAYARGTQERIRANARKGKAQRWLAEDSTRQAVIDFVSVQNGAAGFLGKMAESLLEWGSLTAGQESAVRKIMADRVSKKAERMARDATSEHVGEIGKRITLTATVEYITGFDTQYGYTTVTKLRDASGSLYVFMGVALSMERVHEMHGHAFYEPAKRGDVVTVKGTIKAHDLYQGVKQTKLARPKVESIVSPVTTECDAATHLTDDDKAKRFADDGSRIWLVLVSRANGTVDTYPQQYAGEEAARAAMEAIKLGKPTHFGGFYSAEAGDAIYVDRQY